LPTWLTGFLPEAASELCGRHIEISPVDVVAASDLPRITLLGGRAKHRHVNTRQTGAGVGADVIVVGRRGRGGVAELLLGSVSHELVFHSKRPVLVISSPLQP
jgi:hypothetical protein